MQYIRRYPFEFLSEETDEIVRGISSIYCPVCGEKSDIQPFSDNRRESGVCSNCGSWNRQRLMAIFILNFISKKYGCQAESLASTAIPENIQIFSAEWYGAIHKSLRKLDGYEWSRYAGLGHRSGDVVDGHPHQDLLNTSFINDQFDIVLTADVLEHIPEPYLAHQEIYRILKPGGVHIFTVPSNMNNLLDDQRATVINGEVVKLSDPEWHGIPVDSNLVYTVFGLEMLTHLYAIGFDVQFYEVKDLKKGIIGPRAFIFTAQKKHKPISKNVPVGLRNLKVEVLSESA